MTHTEWQAKQIADKLIGFTVTDAAFDEESFGLVLTNKKTGRTLVAWVLQDPEGNGPGALDITPVGRRV